MIQINEMELQSLRHLISTHETSYNKLKTYAQQCVDPEIKQMFEKAAQSAESTKQKLLSFLS